jgi:transcriptional regulator with XRE-family HTH domain
MTLDVLNITARRTPSPLRLRRLTLGLTQADVAAATGLSREQLSRIETGGCSPHRSTRRLLAVALAADLDDLFPTNSEGPATNGTLAKDAVTPAHGSAA